MLVAQFDGDEENRTTNNNNMKTTIQKSQTNSLLNEHWKRKQRLKERKEEEGKLEDVEETVATAAVASDSNSRLLDSMDRPKQSTKKMKKKLYGDELGIAAKALPNNTLPGIQASDSSQTPEENIERRKFMIDDTFRSSPTLIADNNNNNNNINNNDNINNKTTLAIDDSAHFNDEAVKNNNCQHCKKVAIIGGCGDDSWNFTEKNPNLLWFLNNNVLFSFRMRTRRIEHSSHNLNSTPIQTLDGVTDLNGKNSLTNKNNNNNDANKFTKRKGEFPTLERNRKRKRKSFANITNEGSRIIINFTLSAIILLSLLLEAPFRTYAVVGQSMLIQSDPRPTIYSGQVSFGLLLSAHSSLGAELSTSASHQVVSMLQVVDPPENYTTTRASVSWPEVATTQSPDATTTLTSDKISNNATTSASSSSSISVKTASNYDNWRPQGTTGNASLAGKHLRDSILQTTTEPTVSFVLEPQYQLTSDSILEELIEGQESRVGSHWAGGGGGDKHSIERRQIFERTGQHRRQNFNQPLNNNQLGNNQYRSPTTTTTTTASSTATAAASSGANQANQLANMDTSSGTCSLVNANALYAGMGAIWASHQANLVGDSHLAIGTYVYDSCNDLDVGQRQSVRIVSNLNAFQQTTCESPRGSPISLTIAHGDNQLRAIQLLTSFKVPVITTKEHFDLEDYNQLTRDQKRFLFTTASSSRHLAVGALRFSKRIVSRQVQSPKLPNQFHKMSSKNGLIVISRNLPARFIAYLTEMIPNHVNYEMLQSTQPIDQIRSVEALESILIKTPQTTSESKLILTKAKAPVSIGSGSGNPTNNNNFKSKSPPPPYTNNKRRNKRNLQEDPDSSFGSDNSGNLNSDFDSPSSSEDPDNAKMLSPTILMFITPSEAIDLVTRLRNDLAEVSRYYSLIVTTREDISPALKTIFHRGGSRLCSGKAFYTISPKPDDIGEFSRYFRDTVQMEGESSDHPLVCEFAKYQATTKVNADLDDISTEPVIKAVWSAAAAFKSVHRRECGSLAAASNPLEAGTTNSGTATGSGANSPTSASSSGAPARTMSSRQSNKSAHADCLVKMNKNMSNLVQRALKRLDVTINSTGLQSLDGFRLKFDDLNELMTNKFSIKYINKECEITEIGQYSGFKDSSLRIDEDTLVKSLEGSMPDPWPAQQAKPVLQPTQSAPITTTTPPKTTLNEPSTQGSDVSETTGYDSGDHNNNNQSMRKNRRKGKRGGGGDAPEIQESSRQTEEEDTTPALAGDSSEISPLDPSSNKRNRKRSKPDEKTTPIPKRKLSELAGKRKQGLVAAPVTALGGRNILPGLTDTSEVTPANDPRSTRAINTNGGSTAPVANPITTTTTTSSSSSLATQTTTQKPMRKLKPFPSPVGTTIKDWLPIGEPMTTANTRLDIIQTTTRTPNKINYFPINSNTNNNNDAENNDDDDDEPEEVLKGWPTTQAPVHSTLPESDGNADLEAPAKSSGGRVPKSAPFKLSRALQAAASTSRENSADYVTSPSISKNLYNQQSGSGGGGGRGQPYQLPYQSTSSSLDPFRSPINMSHHQAADGDLPIVDHHRNKDYLKDLNASPIPLSPNSRLPPTTLPPDPSGDESSDSGNAHSAEHKAGRLADSSRIRSHMRWIYSSWYALSILGANVCGALLTLYVLTFLLMRNCDGSLDRDNQGIRSMHLLAIIVVFFGSTLFIVYPTPGLCLLRTSWHNFALVMLFGSLLLQAMQTRSLGSLGLGGRPNRLNQFLTLIFMVGVQVSFELQRWKYESANYLNFVNQYFGNTHQLTQTIQGDKKLMMLNDPISSHKFNILNSFNDQVTPISIQIGEHYQNLLQDYCLQQVDDFLQSQIYLCLIVGLLVIFNVSNRRRRRLTGGPSTSTNHHKLKSTLTSGKLVASQHEANLNLSPSHFQFSTSNSAIGSSISGTGNMFVVTIISSLAYTMSIVLHLYGQNTANRDLIASVTMVLIAFTALIGIFLPILLQIHCRDGLLTTTTTNLSSGTLTRPVMSQSSSKLQGDHLNHLSSPSSPGQNAFTMFPEFAPTGLRRPASISGDSSSGAGSRRTFANTKESRRNMGAALANLGPSADSLRSMGFYTAERKMAPPPPPTTTTQDMEPASTNLKLNSSAIDEPCSTLGDQNMNHYQQHHPHPHHHHHHHQQLHQHQQHNHSSSREQLAKNEKRLIMLDVDPCCPRHGVGAWSKLDDHKGCKNLHCNQ